MEKRLVLLDYDLGDENNGRLRQAFPEFEFFVRKKGDPALAEDLLARAEVLCGYVFNNDRLAQMKNIRYIHTLNAGVDGIVRTLPENIALSTGAGVYGAPLGEHVFALLFALLRGIDKSMLNMSGSRAWKGFHGLGSVKGSHVAILGAGDIGTYVAAGLKALNAKHIAGYKLHPAPAAPPYDAMYAGENALKNVLTGADIVIICLPGTPYTNHLIDDAAFAMMKPGAVLINIGRGNIVDTPAMMRALESGQISGAGLDVTEPEPLPQDHPLWGMENVVITPHYGGWSANHDDLANWFQKNLTAYRDGKPLPGAVNRKYCY